MTGAACADVNRIVANKRFLLCKSVRTIASKQASTASQKAALWSRETVRVES